MGLSSQEVALRQRGCGTPPASELPPGSLTSSCLLRWETARGYKRTAGNNLARPPLPARNPNRFGGIGSPQHFEVSSRHGSLGLPQHLEISSLLGGPSALQSRGAFSRLRPTVLPTPAMPKSHSHRSSWVSSRHRVPTPGEYVRSRGPPGPSFFHRVGNLHSPTRLGTRGLSWRCLPHVYRPKRRSGALPTSGLQPR